MESIKSIRKDLPSPDDTIIDAEIWRQDSEEVHDLVETIVNRQPRFAWMVVDAWCTKHGQLLIDKENHGKV
jgi:hypothetical protein